MKRHGGYIFVAGLVLIGLFGFVNSPRASAESCKDVSNLGAVQLFIPNLKSAGEYQLWVRMQSPSNAAKVLVELNKTECFEVGSTLLTPNTWSWVPYYTNNQNKTINFLKTEGNLINLIGVQSSVKIDRVLISDPGCAPENFGNNCSPSYEPAIANTNEVRIITQNSNNPVSGNVTISETPFTLSESLVSLSYSAQGRTLQSATSAVPFDSTLIENGKHTILIQTSLSDGTVIKESTVISVDNPESILSPLLRTLRQQKSSLLLIGIIVGALAIALIAISLIKKIYIKRRERKFHGF